ncbi:MAG: glycosyltransferase family 2 protein [Defluviitaleaceae bacterium]|nr:glycosyltransferase family 2 protein [Defluviitaleaceae bacterium]
MLLSIGMIVKNEEKYLRACLKSIKPIMDAVHSELIICDTGSTDATVQIAKEFTEHVHSIEWRDDFSWARNHTLEKSKGEWFMYVDADEVFTDVTDLISFFNTGEYKNYKCASYRWRNIIGNGRTADFRPLRLYEMEKGIRFEGKIHEVINNKLPMKHLESIADHHGYDYSGLEGGKKSREKFERNMKLLLDMHKDDPKNPRTIGLIAQDYGNRDPVKSREFIKKGIKILGDNQENIFYHVFNTMLIRNYYSNKMYKETITASKKYLKDVQYMHQALVIIYHHYANACTTLGKHKDAVKISKETIKYFDLNQQGKLDTEIASYHVMPSDILNKRTKHTKTLVLAATLACDFDTALEYLPQCEDDTVDVFSLYMQDCIERECWSDIPALYSYAVKSGYGSDNYHNIITAIESMNNDHEIKKHISQAMAEAKSLQNADDDYMHLHLLRAADGVTTSLDYFLRSDKSFSHHYGDAIFYAMKLTRDFSKFAKNMKITDSTGLVRALIFTNENSHVVLQKFIDMGQWDNLSVKLNRLMSNLAVIAFEKEKNTLSDDEKIRLFEMMIRLNHRYLGMVYRAEAYSAQNVMSLSENDAFVFCVGTAYQQKDLGDMLSYMRNLRSALTINPDMKDMVWLLVEKAKEELEKQA